MADVFDRFLLGINKGVNTVSKNSKIMVERAKLNTMIKEKEDQKRDLINQLGTLAYNMQTSAEINIEQFKLICGEITRCGNEANDLRTEVQRLENQKATPVQDSENSAPAEGGIKCSCGCVNKPGSKFCVECGTRLV